MDLSLADVVTASGGTTVLAAPDGCRRIRNLSWDSRRLDAQTAFLALPGEHFDGNDFLSEAAELSPLLLASRPTTVAERQRASELGAALVELQDPEWALGQIARCWRGKLAAKVIGITGSSGKTSTKELLRVVLATAYRVSASPGNFNNLLGLPAALLATDADAEVLVLEMGMQHFGEIARYAEIAGPQVAVLTNIGSAHLEMLGSREAIARAKAELPGALPDGEGLVVVNGDDPYTPYVLAVSGAEARQLTVLRYGLAEANQVRATNIVYDGDGRPCFDICFPDTLVKQLQLQLQGEHSVLNALAAAAVAWKLGVPVDVLRSALEQSRPPTQRQEVIELSSGTLIINDCYNANPESMRAALTTLQRTRPESPHIAVLGDMGELGPSEQQLHTDLGAEAADLGLALLVCVGQKAAWIAAGARQGGMPPSSVLYFSDWQEAVDRLLSILASRAVILVKASRSMALERITQALIDSY
ncbi:MAG: UDP-N-acetylmuramoyl-tripeptide--D-alanyl-D-alanine ligase [Actinomycetia bacterium]|nr:UDP-N-acetylmuramoyl-tripeptide--D-alanyl-D-alanine ligase [Actinomycetes bacterium]